MGVGNSVGGLEGFSPDDFCPNYKKGGGKPFLGAWAATSGYGLKVVSAFTCKGR